MSLLENMNILENSIITLNIIFVLYLLLFTFFSSFFYSQNNDYLYYISIIFLNKELTILDLYRLNKAPPPLMSNWKRVQQFSVNEVPSNLPLHSKHQACPTYPDSRSPPSVNIPFIINNCNKLCQIHIVIRAE